MSQVVQVRSHLRQRASLPCFFSGAKSRLGWAAVMTCIGVACWLRALAALVAGVREDARDPLEDFLEGWVVSRGLDGWCFADPKNMTDSLRLDCVAAAGRPETHFVQFAHPESGRDTVIGVAPSGLAARYELLSIESDTERQLLRFAGEMARFRNEEELRGVLDSTLRAA